MESRKDTFITSEKQVGNIVREINDNLRLALDPSSSQHHRQGLLALLAEHFQSWVYGGKDKDPSGTVGAALTRLQASGTLQNFPSSRPWKNGDPIGSLNTQGNEAVAEVLVKDEKGSKRLATWIFSKPR